MAAAAAAAAGSGAASAASASVGSAWHMSADISTAPCMFQADVPAEVLMCSRDY
jgi:hypothetical protein